MSEVKEALQSKDVTIRFSSSVADIKASVTTYYKLAIEEGTLSPDCAKVAITAVYVAILQMIKETDNVKYNSFYVVDVIRRTNDNALIKRLGIPHSSRATEPMLSVFKEYGITTISEANDCIHVLYDLIEPRVITCGDCLDAGAEIPKSLQWLTSAVVKTELLPPGRVRASTAPKYLSLVGELELACFTALEGLVKKPLLKSDLKRIIQVTLLLENRNGRINI